MNKDQINIFIVEDNEVFRIALRSGIETVFSEKNIKVHSFETGEKAMENFTTMKPKIVILDYNLNSKVSEAANGIKVLDLIKNKDQETNVILLTSEDNINIATTAFKHGAADYVVKTETQFTKINFSLSNIFKKIDADKEAKRSKRLSVALFCGLSLVIIVAAAVQFLYK